ncbi:integral membrane protein [Flavobacterium fontis]|uniref:Integral membrane protein n=1 Tax=Flavobacterium fontis TaxID=1124188 RepID=A0A1M4ZAF5_9FLAO|nr:DUF3817 domain-containing protein [Flavobacterium fontis]SHF14787.1 integral membrane protein [Flavobacterium fontis]
MTTLFRFVAWGEGLSYIALFINMLLIKPTDLTLYKTLLFPIGMAHGILFIGYVYLAFAIKSSQRWTWKDLFWVELASLLPFGTFVAEKRFVKNAS